MRCRPATQSREERNGRIDAVLRLALLIVLGSLTATAAHAGNVMFGYQEHLYKVSDTTLRSKYGEPLSLGHKVTLNYFLGGCWVSDDGYVLLMPDAKHYYELNKSDIQSYQAEGTLPKPLPGYSIPFSDWFFGTSLWTVGAFTLLLSAIFRWQDRGVKPPPTLTDVLKGGEQPQPPPQT